MKILIAEDDYASRSAIANYLKQYGQCDITVDGEEAIEAYMMALDAGEHYDLICLDAQMPFRSGFEVAEAIRAVERERDVPDSIKAKIIMTTALSYEVKKLVGEDLYYCAKPFNFESLKEVMKYAGLIV